MAEEAGAAVLRGRTARAIEGDSVRLDDGAEMAADALFLATGKHELRGVAREIGARPLSVGLRAAVPPPPDLAGTIELHLYDGGYAGLLVQEDGSANLCLSVAQARMAEGRDAFLAALMKEAPLLAERIGGADPRLMGGDRRRALWLARARDRAGPVPGRRPGGGDRQPRRRRHRGRLGERRGGGPCLPPRRRRAGLSARFRDAGEAAASPSPRRSATWRRRRCGGG